MQMLDTFDLSAGTPGAATCRESSRSTAATESKRADRSVSRDREPRGPDETTEFEDDLIGLTAACAASSPCADSNNVKSSERQGAQDESHGLTLSPMLVGCTSNMSTSVGSPHRGAENASSPTIVLPTGSFGSAMIADDATAMGETSSLDQTMPTTTDEFVRQALPAALAEESLRSLKISAPQEAGGPDANSQPNASLEWHVTSPTEVTLHDPSAPIVNDPARESLKVNDASPTQATAGPQTNESDGAAHNPLSRIAAALTAHEGAASRPDATSGDLDRDAQGSNQDSRSDGVDSLSADQAVVDTTTSLVTDNSTRSNPAPGASVTEQIFGEIATRVEMSHRDGRIDFRLRLDPPGMGTVHVRLTATEHSISAQVVADDPAAHRAIEGQLHTLRESLANLGVSLEQFGVAHDDGGSRGAWRWQHPEPQSTTSGLGPRSSMRNRKPPSSRPRAGEIDVVV
jgi:flagellar hook-length control protein FliK